VRDRDSLLYLSCTPEPLALFVFSKVFFLEKPLSVLAVPASSEPAALLPTFDRKFSIREFREVKIRLDFNHRAFSALMTLLNITPSLCSIFFRFSFSVSYLFVPL